MEVREEASVLSDDILTLVTERRILFGAEESYALVKRCRCVYSTYTKLEWCTSEKRKVRLRVRISRNSKCSKHHAWRLAKNVWLIAEGGVLKEVPLL
jgi:hypothetical protein